MSEPSTAQREIKRLESAGDFLQAYERARKAIAADPADARHKYIAVRCLARSGATRQALDLYERFDLGKSDDLDFLTLRGRLAKDAALGLAGEGRRQGLREAAKVYEQIHRRIDAYYPAINAATLYLLAGEVRRAEGYAKEALAYCLRDAAKGELDDYYRLASQAEAHLVLEETVEAMEALHKLASISRDDLAARASTRRQLRLILDAKGWNDSILDPLTPPEVVHYTGHPIGPAGLAPGTETALRREIASAMERRQIGVAFGSLAAGADILFAEECLARGIELNLVFPFGIDAFKAASVKPSGNGWLERFDAALARAASVTHATDSDFTDDESLPAYAAELAMGKAILRARFIDARAVQIAAWNRQPSETGVAADIARWQASGHESRLVPVEATVRGRAAQADSKGCVRELRPLMFGDTAGFSRLREGQLRQYRKLFFGTIATELEACGDDVLSANSWGDAIYLVMADAARAARCAVGIQEELRAIDFPAHGFEHPLRLRLSLHYGPVFPGLDELTGAQTYFGKEVTFAARMEPVTPPGEVYATEELASQLALAGETEIAADYVGTVELAKQYGTAPMYLLRRTRPAERESGESGRRP